MMKLNLKEIMATLLLLLFASQGWPESFISTECRPLVLAEELSTGPEQFDKGVLWKVSKPGLEASYLLGTIHVADKRVLDLPPQIEDALYNSGIYVMEALPDVSEMLSLTSMMFLVDGRKLQDLIPKSIFDGAVKILGNYAMPTEAVSLLKPWAAYLTMNYPPEGGAVLDLELLQKAKTNGAEVYGLETMAEQVAIFEKMSMQSQIRLLIDTVCHYDLVIEDFETMKLLYLQRDLKRLYEYSNRFSIEDEQVYETLFENLLTKRNYVMSDRIEKYLQRGNAFVAIGALHLPGDEGVLHLLEKRGYDISVVY